MSKTKITKCIRCGKRQRNSLDGWNTQHVAGISLGVICPGCQTSEEDIEAQINEIGTDYNGWTEVVPNSSHDANTRIIEGLIRSYPTSALMRAKADLLERHRPDYADTMVTLMRRMADDMESGALWEDGVPS